MVRFVPLSMASGSAQSHVVVFIDFRGISGNEGEVNNKNTKGMQGIRTYSETGWAASALLSKMWFSKKKGVSFVSKFDRGCACAMWADLLFLPLGLFVPKKILGRGTMSVLKVFRANNTATGTAIWLRQLCPSAESVALGFELPMWQRQAVQTVTTHPLQHHHCILIE